MPRSAQSPDESSPTDAAALARLHPTAFAHLVNPRYEPGEVHWRIGDALRRVEAREIDRLLILAPPRHGKSELASVYFPAWFLGRNPDARVIAASYSAQLADHNGRQVRDLVASPGFRAVFPEMSVSQDAAAADYWVVNGRRGGYLAAGVGGAMTGFGADLLVIDDPIKNMEEADSALQRDRLEEWLYSVALSRLEPGGRVVVAMTRWHPDDIAGRIMRAAREGRDRWEVLELPALGADDAPLWPERFDLEAIERRRHAVDDRTWAALYQQQPVSASGTVFEREWLRRFERPPTSRECAARFIAVDTAYKDGEHNDYTVAVIGDVAPDYSLRLREVWRRRVKFPELIAGLTALTQKWNYDGKLNAVLIEDAASGTSALQTLRDALPPQSAALLVASTPRGSKLERARLASAWVREGAVALPVPSDEVPWLFDFEKEFFEFPGSIHDDQVDALVHLLLYLEHILAAGIRFRAESGQRGSLGISD